LKLASRRLGIARGASSRVRVCALREVCFASSLVDIHSK